MNELENIFKSHDGYLIHKWQHYFEIYDRHLSKYKGKCPSILEIGISQGGSLQMWEKYFGKGVKIYGIDINPVCKKFESENIKIFIGSQEDPNFLNYFKQHVDKLDIIIDDGGHTMRQLKTSFDFLYDHVNENGIYLAEDLHTCYMYEFNGGLKRKSNFIEYTKDLIDKIYEYYYKNKPLSTFAQTTYSIHYYQSIIVFEKRKIEEPKDLVSGHKQSDEIDGKPMKSFIKSWKYLKYLLDKYTFINIP